MGLLAGIIGVIVVLAVIGSAFPVLWPVVSGTATTAVEGMNGTDSGTTTFQTFWPIALLFVGLGIGVGLIVFALRKFGLLGGMSFGIAPVVLNPVLFAVFALYLSGAFIVAAYRFTHRQKGEAPTPIPD